MLTPQQRSAITGPFRKRMSHVALSIAPDILMLAILAALLALIAIYSSGCALTPLQQLDIAGKSVDRTWKVVYPIWDARCRTEARKCINLAPKPGEGTMKDQCPGAKTCLDGLSAFKLALDAVDQAIMVGVPLAAVSKPTAANWAATALDALLRAVGLAQQAGILPSTWK